MRVMLWAGMVRQLDVSRDTSSAESARWVGGKWQQKRCEGALCLLDGPWAVKRKERTSVMKVLCVLLDGPWAVKGTG